MTRKEEKYKEFEQMLSRSHSILIKICLAFTDRQYDNVLDLYQEIVCNLWQGWHDFRGESNFTTWLYRIALNTAAMDYRKRKKRKNYIAIDSTVVKNLVEEAEDPRKDKFYHLINQLSADEKEIIMLFLDRLTYAQIADICGTTEAAAKQKIYRIKQKLKQLHLRNDDELYG